MDEAECETLVRLTDDFMKTDLILLLHHLKKMDTVDSKVLLKLTDLYVTGLCDRTKLCEMALAILQTSCNMDCFLHALDLCGYQDLRRKTVQVLEYLRNNKTPLVVKRQGTTSGASLTKFLTDLRKLVDDQVFEDPRKSLRRLSNAYKLKLSLSRDPRRRQLIADRYAAVLWTEIDAYAMTFHSVSSINRIFQELKSLSKETSSESLTNLNYFCRLIVTRVNAEDLAGLDLVLQAARACAGQLTSCLEQADLFYIETYVKLLEYEQNPSEEVRTAVMQMGDLGMQCLDDQHESVLRHWKRKFLLRMAYCLLGIANHTNIIQSANISMENIKLAKRILAEVDRNWKGIEARREMFYCVARARLCELEEMCDLALEYTKRANKLAMQGHYRKRKLIIEYMLHLQEKVRKSRYGIGYKPDNNAATTSAVVVTYNKSDICGMADDPSIQIKVTTNTEFTILSNINEQSGLLCRCEYQNDSLESRRFCALPHKSAKTCRSQDKGNLNLVSASADDMEILSTEKSTDRGTEEVSEYLMTDILNPCPLSDSLFSIKQGVLFQPTYDPNITNNATSNCKFPSSLLRSLPQTCIEKSRFSQSLSSDNGSPLPYPYDDKHCHVSATKGNPGHFCAVKDNPDQFWDVKDNSNYFLATKDNSDDFYRTGENHAHFYATKGCSEIAAPKPSPAETECASLSSLDSELMFGDGAATTEHTLSFYSLRVASFESEERQHTCLDKDGN